MKVWKVYSMVQGEGYWRPELSAIWETEDQRFRFFRDPDGWSVYGHRQEAEEWLFSIGLEKARFPTRRDAIAALELALTG